MSILLIQNEIQESMEVKKRLLESQTLEIQKLAELCIAVLESNHTIFFCGNGGSSCDASHIATELVVRYKSGNERRALPALALGADFSLLTACSNDYGYEQVFQRQIQALGKPGDLLIGISTSGNSKNILLAVEEAKKQGMKTASLLGGTGGKLFGACDCEILVPSKITARIQESHILIGHILCSFIEKKLFNLD